jgi:hypothetical protein
VALAGERHRRLLQLGDTEVHDPGALVAGDEDVLRLEVAVDDPGGVDGLEAGGDLDRDLAEQRFGHGAEIAQQPPERAPLHELHHQEVGGLAVGSDLADVEGANDVLVIDPLADLRLLDEAPQESGLGEQVGVHDLERHPLARLQAGGAVGRLGQVDGPHSPLAELGGDSVGAQRPA